MEFNLLLSLPAELRNHVYQLHFGNSSDIPIDRYTGHLDDRKRLYNLLALTRVNRQLYHEALPFYWSSTPFHINHPGHRDLSSYDEKFYLWMTQILKDSVKDIRKLRFTVNVPYIYIKPGATSDPSKALINIDLTYATVDDAISVEGYYSTYTNLQILPWVRKAVARIPRVDKKPLVTCEVLWDIYESCYFIMRSDATERRSWPEFTRAYEMNALKPTPQRWSESTFHDMSQELLHGPNWRDRANTKQKAIWSEPSCPSLWTLKR